MPFKIANKTLTMPDMALKRRAKKKNPDAIECLKILGSKRQKFNKELELCEHITDMEGRMYGLTAKDFFFRFIRGFYYFRGKMSPGIILRLNFKVFT